MLLPKPKVKSPYLYSLFESLFKNPKKTCQSIWCFLLRLHTLNELRKNAIYFITYYFKTPLDLKTTVYYFSFKLSNRFESFLLSFIFVLFLTPTDLKYPSFCIYIFFIIFSLILISTTNKGVFLWITTKISLKKKTKIQR